MNPLLMSFLTETRDALDSIGGLLMQLERTPTDSKLINELFRLVHTLKGCSGFFSFPDMTRVLHAGEDLMVAMREGQVSYSQDMADQLLETMDFTALLCDEIESSGEIAAIHAMDSAQLAAKLHSLIGKTVTTAARIPPISQTSERYIPSLVDISEYHRMEAFRHVYEGHSLYWIVYTPAENCFFQGTDPLASARQTPGLLFGCATAREPWPELATLDVYRCILEFHMLVAATNEDLASHFRQMPDQVCITAIDPLQLIVFPGDQGPTPKPILDDVKVALCVMEDIIRTYQHPVYPSGECPEEDKATLAEIFHAQQQILTLSDQPCWLPGRLKSVATVLIHCTTAMGDPSAHEISAALTCALEKGSGTPLLEWLNARMERVPPSGIKTNKLESDTETAVAAAAQGGEESKFGRRAEDQFTPKVLKVDQGKIDRLMNLIGEMVVSKNALPYLAQRAENQFGVRELSREIKAQYTVINRIAEEMQDAIMQVRMMPVSAVFQRFSRLVRDISRKLGKEVELILEGEETEADKNIIESLADPLIHIVRNSLDHGLELPDIRRACGKSAKGTLTIRASQDADRVFIEIIDDGKGIDPTIIKKKALEKGLIDEATLEQISDQDAIHLVFAPGFSTAEEVSDLSGRGVGMDVVKSAVEKVHGALQLESEVGKGTIIRISLPLSMAVTKVMIVESDRQIFGVPMDHVVETVRISSNAIHMLKQNMTTLFRGRVLPLKPLNGLLNLLAAPKANSENELAVLVVRVGSDVVGLIVDDFSETLDVIQKPLGSILSGLSVYSGSALMGDGTVLMVLNVKEIM